MTGLEMRQSVEKLDIVSPTLDLIPFKQQNLLMDILLYLKFNAYLSVSPAEIVLSTFSNPVPSVGAEMQ